MQSIDPEQVATICLPDQQAQENSNVVYQCGVCNLVFHSEDKVNAHVETHAAEALSGEGVVVARAWESQVEGLDTKEAGQGATSSSGERLVVQGFGSGEGSHGDQVEYVYEGIEGEQGVEFVTDAGAVGEEVTYVTTGEAHNQNMLFQDDSGQTYMIQSIENEVDNEQESMDVQGGSLVIAEDGEERTVTMVVDREEEACMAGGDNDKCVEVNGAAMEVEIGREECDDGQEPMVYHVVEEGQTTSEMEAAGVLTRLQGAAGES